MLPQINPIDIILGHLRTLSSPEPAIDGGYSFKNCFLFLASGIPFSLGQVIILFAGMKLQAEIVGIIVSAASIVAGLLLNLLVMLYSLAAQQASKLGDSRSIFERIVLHTFYNISFAVFSALLLVLSALAALANNHWIWMAGNVLTFYFGAITCITLLMVLRKFHKLFNFHLKRTHSGSDEN